MSLVISINSGKDFELLSEGVHAAVLAAIEDLGDVPTQYGTKHKIRFVYLTDEADEDGRTKLAFQRFTASLHEKASLRKAVKAIRGKDLEASEVDFDVESLIGSQVQLVIQHSEDNQGKAWANVDAILKAKPGIRVTIPSDFEFKPKAKEGNQAQAAAPRNAQVKAAGGGRSIAEKVYRPPVTQPDNPLPIGDDDIPF